MPDYSDFTRLTQLANSTVMALVCSIIISDSDIPEQDDQTQPTKKLAVSMYGYMFWVSMHAKSAHNRLFN